jgi:hypothetical protein
MRQERGARLDFLVSGHDQVAMLSLIHGIATPQRIAAHSPAARQRVVALLISVLGLPQIPP